MPSRSETNRSELPSGSHIGHKFRHGVFTSSRNPRSVFGLGSSVSALLPEHETEHEHLCPTTQICEAPDGLGPRRHQASPLLLKASRCHPATPPHCRTLSNGSSSSGSGVPPLAGTWYSAIPRPPRAEPNSSQSPSAGPELEHVIAIVPGELPCLAPLQVQHVDVPIPGSARSEGEPLPVGREARPVVIGRVSDDEPRLAALGADEPDVAGVHKRECAAIRREPGRAQVRDRRRLCAGLPTAEDSFQSISFVGVFRCSSVHSSRERIGPARASDRHGANALAAATSAPRPSRSAPGQRRRD